jgi:hypothetical protein
MKKEFKPNQDIEIELKLPTPFSAVEMKEILNDNFGVGSERTYERTVMYDNSNVLTSGQHEFIFTRDRVRLQY